MFSPVQDLMDLVKRLLLIVTTDETIASCTTGAKLCQLDIEKNLRPSEKCDFGFGTKSRIKKLSPSEKLEFRHDCQKLVIGILRKIFDRSPLKFSLTRAISSLSPTVVSHSVDQAVKRFDALLTILHEKNHVLAIVADKAKEQFSKLMQDSTFREEARKFDWTTHRLDNLFNKFVGSKPAFTELWEIIKLVLILSHGNARVESGFSINQSPLLSNMKERTIVSQRIVYDAIRNARRTDS